jgi:hypothetical protein
MIVSSDLRAEIPVLSGAVAYVKVRGAVYRLMQTGGRLRISLAEGGIAGASIVVEPHADNAISIRVRR